MTLPGGEFHLVGYVRVSLYWCACVCVCESIPAMFVGLNDSVPIQCGVCVCVCVCVYVRACVSACVCAMGHSPALPAATGQRFITLSCDRVGQTHGTPSP